MPAHEAQRLSGERVCFLSKPETDWDGNLIPGSGSVTKFCRVYPAGMQDTDDIDFDGNTSKLTVQAPAGSYEVGQEVEIRGQVYEIVHAPFDFAHGRKAAHPDHRPKVLITVELPQVGGDADGWRETDV